MKNLADFFFKTNRRQMNSSGINYSKFCNPLKYNLDLDSHMSL